MPRAPSAAVNEALETLIAQFSQPLSFLRELVQNSLDAGTNRVDVSVRWEEADSCAVVEVADTGEGMDRAVIDGQLTRLFSSSKEGDLTKIGKFGIGFVSVFAIGPQAVVVDTARGGEAWRVLFHPDRTFDRLVLDEPVEGTRVAVWVPMPRKKLEKFRQDCLETVRFWCKHCEVEIRFDGEPVNQPFALEAPFQVRHEVPGTEVVVAPSPDPRPFHGFYNRGLTLLEGAGSPLEGVSFKVRSRYLEHTLTRDNVMHDENYDKAMAIVREVADRRLPPALFEKLREAPSPDLWRAAATLLAHRPARGAEDVAVFPTLDGTARSLREVRAMEHPVYTAAPDDPLARAVPGPVLQATGPSDPMLKALQAAGVSVQEVAERWRLPRPAETSPGLQALLEEAAPLLAEAGFRQVAGADLGSALCLRIRELGRPQPRDSRDGRILGVNPEHMLVLHLQGLAEHDRSLAAYLLARGTLLDLGCPMDAAADLLGQAMDRRRRTPPQRTPKARERRK